MAGSMFHTLFRPISVMLSEIQASRQQSFLIVLATWLFVGLFGWLTLHTILIPEHIEFNNTMLLDLLVAALLVCGSLMLPRSWWSKVSDFLDRYIWVVLLLLFLVHCTIAFYLQVDITAINWDAGVIAQSALETVTNPGLATTQWPYFADNPNNVGIWVFLSLALWVADWVGIGDLNFFTILLNVVLMNLAAVFTYLVARKYWGGRVALITLPFIILFITLSLWTQVFYTDTVGMLFPVLVLYFLAKLAESERVRWIVIWGVGAGVAVGLGYLIKPTTFILLIAVVLVHIFADVYRRMESRLSLSAWMQSTLLKISGVMIGLGVLMGVWYTIIYPLTGIKGEGLMPSHYFMMGLNTSCNASLEPVNVACGHGGWSWPDAGRHLDYDSMTEYQQFTYEEIGRRLSGFGVGGYINHLTDKGAWILGDGTFHGYGEGNGKGMEPLFGGRGTELLASFMIKNGQFYGIFVNVLQVGWLAMLWLILIPILKGRTEYGEPESILRVSLLGLLLFLLLFEARSRYLYVFLPLFILLAVYGLKQLAKTNHK